MIIIFIEAHLYLEHIQYNWSTFIYWSAINIIWLGSTFITIGAHNHINWFWSTFVTIGAPNHIIIENTFDHNWSCNNNKIMMIDDWSIIYEIRTQWLIMKHKKSYYLLERIICYLEYNADHIGTQ